MFAYYKLCPKCQHCSHHQNTLPPADSKRRDIYLCHNILNEETWAGPGCWNQTCSMQRRPGVPPEPDAIKILSVSGWDLFFATAFEGVQSGPLLAQKLFCKAGPCMTMSGSCIDINIQTIRNGSSSIKHPNTILGTTMKSGSTSGLLWSASPEIICSSSHSGESWQLQGNRSWKRYSMFSSWEITEAIFSQWTLTVF